MISLVFKPYSMDVLQGQCFVEPSEEKIKLGSVKQANVPFTNLIVVVSQYLSV